MAFDVTNQADLTALKTEVETDPFGIGYDAAGGNTQNILDKGNFPENNTNGDEVNVPFDEFPIIDAVDEIVKSEYDSLSARDKTYVDAIIQAAVASSQDNGIGVAYFGPVKKLFRKAFGTSSNTWLAVKDDRARPASRFEALFGRDVVISRNDWIQARENG